MLCTEYRATVLQKLSTTRKFKRYFRYLIISYAMLSSLLVISPSVGKLIHNNVVLLLKSGNSIRQKSINF